MIENPIIVYDQGDVLVFESISLAERYLEIYDLNEYVGYDSEGRLLHLTTYDNLVKIELAELEPNHISELQMILIKFFSEIGIERDWLLKASLNELIEKSLEYKIE